MKIFKILTCLAFVLVISACHDKNKTIYDYPDDDPTTEQGNIGDPCEKNIDCKDGLVCLDKVCSEPVTDQDQTDDTDTEPDGDEPTDDADTTPTDDTDSDTGDHDINPTDDTDTNPDEDEPEDTDSQPDEDPYVPECGNGIRDEGEECDNGIGNSDEPGILGITCRTNCTLAFCGDGIADNGELCDDGNNADGDYCRYDCQGITGYCGDGIEQFNEKCDKRNNPYCSEDCQTKLGECGDGIKQSFEVCDNAVPDVGNHEGIGTYCSEDCKKKEHSCGDGTVQHDMEDCDDGANNGKYGHCNLTCSDYAPYCGDGILQRSNCNGYGANCVVVAGANEACDDGNNSDGDYCSSDCQTSFGSCGDGTVQDFEKCDKAKKGVGDGQGIGVYCSDDCQTKFGECGDGILNQDSNGNPLEECDYGNYGQNGPVPNGNLYCDYASFAPCERCTLDCKKVTGKIVFCGDGERQPVEACDKGNDNGKTDCAYGEMSCKVCSTDCTKESNGKTSFCGDGIIDELNSEECDPNKTDDPNSQYCSDECKIEGRCGDGLPNGNEECDNGETGTNPNGNTKCAYGEMECKVCSTNCKESDGETSYCGNGGIDESNGEQCDDRQNNGKYKLSEPGFCNKNCEGWGEGGFCGDGILQRANCSGFGSCTTVEGAAEECDNGKEGTNPNGNTKCAYGEMSCTVCTNSCTQTAGTETSYCGDGKVDSENGEQCDDGNNEDGDYCSADCKTKTGSCGDGTKQDKEACDKADPSFGNHEGIGIYCSDDCQRKFGECGDGIRNKDSNGNWLEVCDDGVNNGKYSPDANNLYCNENCQGKGEGGYCGDTTWQDEEECEHGGNIQVYCPYGQENCQVCASDCTLKAGKTAKCNDGIIQRTDCTGYEDKGCVVTPNAQETCDDGQNNGKYGGFCNSECKGITPYCNDGILQRSDCTGHDNCETFAGADEDCDDGQNNGKYSVTAPGYCNSGCKGRGAAGYCGDGVWQKDNESCDSGTENNGKYGFCNNDCSGDSPKCGDGIIHREDCTGHTNCEVFEGVNEECDDGEENGSYNHCNNSCTATPTCGDGIIQREDCTGMAICDENTTENCCVEVVGATEKCDDGEENGGYEKCNSTCTDYNEAGYCGDGILQKANCEGYDICDENITENCCVVTPGADEKCDSGANNGKYSLEAPGYCNSNCDGFAEGGTCNDGIIQREDCAGFDICDENITENCCVVTEGANESCDEGDDNGQYNSCNSTCSGRSSCGDGIRDKDSEGNWLETCDDGFLNGAYGNNCNADCDGYTGYCDDGIIQRPNCEGYDNCVVTLDGTEECDEGTFLNGSYGHCNDSCSGDSPKCGDGIIHREDCGDLENCVEIPGTYENCDDGDENGQFGKCDKNCSETVTWQCGDGVVDELHGEICDYGLDPHCNQTCDGWLPYCGDLKIQREDCGTWILCDEDISERCCEEIEGMNEACDHGNNNGKQGFCYGDCSGECGDGILQKHDCGDLENCVVSEEANEACDEGGNNGQPGHCNRTCTGETVVAVCGNGIIEEGERCDDGNTIDNDYCSADCRRITGRCGDGEWQTNEACDEGEENNGYHGHCNEECTGTSICGDGKLGKDEFCDGTEMVAEIPCSEFQQFKFTDETIIIDSCTPDCRPDLSQCTYDTLYISPFFTTGQTLCYNNTETTDCHESALPFFGQEPEFAYTAHDYDTSIANIIEDNNTGLMWEKYTPSIYEGEIEGYHFSKAEGEKWEARFYCQYLTLGGYDNWRLPTAAELSTITDYSSATHIYSDFENTSSSYWTEEEFIFSSADGTYLTSTDTDTAKIKCVRSVNEESGCTAFQCQEKRTDSDLMFVFDSPNTVITFATTGTESVGLEMFANFWYFSSLEVGDTWENALAFCQGIGKDENNDNNGLKNLRLPTVNELMWLIDWTNGGSLIPRFTGKKAWTSTTVDNVPATHPIYPYANSHAYAVDFSTGSVIYEPKTNSNIVICVE